MITVIFSSFNGERTLTSTLEAFSRLVPPPGGWELIAVDNGSTDGTAALLSTYDGLLPMRRLFVPERGKNHGLNAAIDHARGQLLVFTDDDVVPDPQWLCALHACAEANADHDLFGGAIVPRWPRTPPAWLLEHVPLGMVYAATPERPDAEAPVDAIWGGNMAVRRSIFDQGLRYNGAVGPDGSTRYAMGAETEFNQRLGGAGAKAWFCPAARVEHLIREHQLATRWILGRFFRYGRFTRAMAWPSAERSHRILGIERWLWRQLIVSGAAAVWWWLCRRPGRAFQGLSRCYETRGWIYQDWQERRAARARNEAAVPQDQDAPTRFAP